MAKKSVYLPHKHTFWYKRGRGKPFPRKALVRPGTETIEMWITAEHFEKAKPGNGAECGGALCTLDHASQFPHPVEGMDWTDSRAYIEEKLDREGFPVSCYVYLHNERELCIAKVNDDEKLRKAAIKILREEGPRKIVLTPYRVRPAGSQVGEGTGRKRNFTGERGANKAKRRGANLRAHRVSSGLV